MFLTLLVSELPVIPETKGTQRVYVRVDGPLGDIEELSNPEIMDQKLRDFFNAARDYIKSSPRQAPEPASPDDASSTSE